MIMIASWLLQPAAPRLEARWLRANVARLAWQQPANVHLTCISRNAMLLRCWIDLPASSIAMQLGDVGPLDASAHPAAGDVYTLDLDGRQEHAPLRSVKVLAIVRR